MFMSTKRTSSRTSISKCAPETAGWFTGRTAPEKFKLRTAYVAPHLQTWHAPRMPFMEVVASGRYASIGLNDAITAADRKHAERALRRFGMYSMRGRTLAEMSYG